MKNLPLFFLLCLLSIFELKAQVMHSSNAMEYSIGGERFSQFIAQTASFQSGGNLGTPVTPTSPVFRWQPVVSGRYKKFQDRGNYFGFGLYFGHSAWNENVSFEGFFDIGSGDIFSSTERNRETKTGISYQYSFLMNKENQSNFQFFIGGGADFYASFADKIEDNFFFFPFLRRNIIGARISAIPELIYIVPNSRITLSLRGIVPLADLQRVKEDLRQPTFRSFIESASVSSNFQLASIGLSRFELGFGYFLKAK